MTNAIMNDFMMQKNCPNRHGYASQIEYISGGKAEINVLYSRAFIITTISLSFNNIAIIKCNTVRKKTSRKTMRS